MLTRMRFDDRLEVKGRKRDVTHCVVRLKCVRYVGVALIWKKINLIFNTEKTIKSIIEKTL